MASAQLSARLSVSRHLYRAILSHARTFDRDPIRKISLYRNSSLVEWNTPFAITEEEASTPTPPLSPRGASAVDGRLDQLFSEFLGHRWRRQYLPGVQRRSMVGANAVANDVLDDVLDDVRDGGGDDVSDGDGAVVLPGNDDWSDDSPDEVISGVTAQDRMLLKAAIEEANSVGPMWSSHDSLFPAPHSLVDLTRRTFRESERTWRRAMDELEGLKAANNHRAIRSLEKRLEMKMDQDQDLALAVLREFNRANSLSNTIDTLVEKPSAAKLIASELKDRCFPIAPPATTMAMGEPMTGNMGDTELMAQWELRDDGAMEDTPLGGAGAPRGDGAGGDGAFPQSVRLTPADSLEAGMMLIAHPLMVDSTFAHTCILLYEYDARKGAAGLVINRPLIPITVQHVLSSTSAELHGEDEPQAKHVDTGRIPELEYLLGPRYIFHGGPIVSEEELPLLHFWGHALPHSRAIANLPGLYISHDLRKSFHGLFGSCATAAERSDALKRLLTAQDGKSSAMRSAEDVSNAPQDEGHEAHRMPPALAEELFVTPPMCAPFVGHSAWQPGQLEKEMVQGSWVACTLDTNPSMEDDGDARGNGAQAAVQGVYNLVKSLSMQAADVVVDMEMLQSAAPTTSSDGDARSQHHLSQAVGESSEMHGGVQHLEMEEDEEDDEVMFGWEGATPTEHFDAEFIEEHGKDLHIHAPHASRERMIEPHDLDRRRLVTNGVRDTFWSSAMDSLGGEYKALARLSTITTLDLYHHAEDTME